MSDETTDNFWKVIQQFHWPDTEPVSYRLYHDEHGAPLFYTMEDLPGTYIEVDQTTYIRGSYHVAVRDGRLIVFEPKVEVSRLILDREHGTPCHPRDVCIVVQSARPHQKWIKQTNDIH